MRSSDLSVCQTVDIAQAVTHNASEIRRNLTQHEFNYDSSNVLFTRDDKCFDNNCYDAIYLHIRCCQLLLYR